MRSRINKRHHIWLSMTHIASNDRVYTRTCSLTDTVVDVCNSHRTTAHTCPIHHKPTPTRRRASWWATASATLATTAHDCPTPNSLTLTATVSATSATPTVMTTVSGDVVTSRVVKPLIRECLRVHDGNIVAASLNIWTANILSMMSLSSDLER